MNTKDLFNKEVLDVNAKKVGSVVDIDFDLNNGVLNHIIVQAGVFKKLAIDVNQLDKIGDRLVLNVTTYDLEQKK